MLTFLALTVVPLAALALIMLAAVWFTRQVVERMVGRKHRLLEDIVRTGEIPAAWRAPFARRLAAPGAAARRAAQARAQAAYLAKLDDLTRYAETSPFVADQDARDTLLDRLDEVRAAWSAARPPDS